MNYEEYIKMVPERTKKFTNLFLKLFYVYGNHHIADISNFCSKEFAMLLSIMYKFEDSNKTKNLLNEYRISRDVLDFYDIKELEKVEVNYNDVFSLYSYVFEVLKFNSQYVLLTPERIIYEYYNSNDKEISLKQKFFKPHWRGIFENNYREHVSAVEVDLKSNMEAMFYKDLSYELIFYLKKAAEIFRYMERENTYNSKLIKNYEDMTATSLLLAVYDSSDMLSLFFEGKGLTRDIYFNTLIPNYKKYNFDDVIAVLIMHFKRYLEEDLSKGIARGDLTIQKVISNVFNRDYTKSLVIETVLHEANLSLLDFANFENQLNLFKEQYINIKNQKKVNDYFENISDETVVFMKLVSQIHQVIKDNLKENKYIKNENDICVLSIFIGSFLVKNDFVNYFKDNDITLEKIVSELGINKLEEQIDKKQVDIDLIINNYGNFICGDTSNKEKVSINNVLLNLCSSEKIDSNSILKLVKDINPNIKLSDNLSLLITSYNKKKEEIRRFALEQSFFEDMPIESINFIKKAARDYEALEHLEATIFFTKDDLVQIAIYHTIINYEDLDEAKFLSGLVKKENRPLFIVKIPDDYNIDIISSYFEKYVFGLKNKDKKKSDITIKDIYTNIFNKDDMSIYLQKYLADIDFNYESFINFDECFEKYLLELKKFGIISRISLAKRTYFEDLSKIYQNLINMSKEGNLVYNYSENNDKIRWASCLLSIFINESSYIYGRLKLLANRGITLDSYLQYLNISMDDFNKYHNEKIDYLLIDKEFKDILEGSVNRGDIVSSENILILLFWKYDNGYIYKDYLNYLNQVPEVIEKEMIIGKEVIVPLSKDEQINYLMNLPIDSIDYSLNSVSTFGNELAEHSLMIADEFVNIAIMGNENERVLNIQKELSKLRRKPSVFAKKKPMSEKIADNKAILDNLNDTLKENEARIIETINHFGYLKKLTAVYIYRLSKHIEVLEGAINNFTKMNFMKSGLENIDNQTILTALQDKLNDYQTSLAMSTCQYQKISLLLNTHFINLNRTVNARNTTIPNLYIELSIRNSIILSKESSADLNSINDLLNSIVKANNQALSKDNFQVKGNEVPKGLIEQVKKELLDETLISSNIDEEGATTVEKVKK